MAILAVHPKAKIIERCVDDYPIRVKIFTQDGTEVFNTDQRNLFSKYATKRKESIEQIKKIVEGL